MKEKSMENTERIDGKERHSREDFGLEKTEPKKDEKEVLKEDAKSAPDKSAKNKDGEIKEKGGDEIVITDKTKTIDEIIDSAKLKRSLDKIKSSMGKEDRSEIKFGKNRLEIERDKGDFKYKLNGKEINEKDLQKFLENGKEIPVTKEFVAAAKKEKDRLMEKELARLRSVAEHTSRRDSFRHSEIEDNANGKGGSELYDDLREREDAALAAER